MAARDLARGVLTDAQLQRIQDTMAALVAEIGSQPDKEPEPGVADDIAHGGMIRCVAGRTEIEELRVANLVVRSGFNDIRLGIAAVTARLRTGRLKIHATC